MTNAMNPLIKEDVSPNKGSKLPEDPTIKLKDGQNDKQLQESDPFLIVFVWFIILMLGFLVVFPLPYIFKDETIGLTLNRYETRDMRGGEILSSQRYTPEQLHLSLGSNSKEIYITWSTKHTTMGNSYVEICKYQPGTGCIQLVKKIWGEETVRKFPNNDEKWFNLTRKKSRKISTYRARVIGLEPNALYIYRAVAEFGSDHPWYSETYQFLANDFSDTNRTVRMVFYGDLGLVNGQSVPKLIEEADYGYHDLIIHNGDFAYDLDTHNGKYGDEFMRMIEPIAARVPYQTSVGNHEIANNFSHYDHRFTMVNSGGHNIGEHNNFFYSFNVGPIHYIAFSTEFYYFLEISGMEALNKQYEWLKKDLELASSPSERIKRPWIIVFGHRPMYCSSRDRDDCTKDTNILRKGLPFIGSYALEKLFYDHGVDVQLYSHEHMYERFLPIYDGKVYIGNDSIKNPYYNPLAPVHLISGSAGCQERLDPFKNKTAPGSVRQISDYGFLRIEATRCKIRFVQYSTDQFKEVDDFTIEKTYSQNFPTRKTLPDIDCTMNNDLKNCPRGWVPGACS